MSKINLHTYEAFLLDYSEGNLSALEIAELKDFAANNPDLEIDFESLELPFISEETAAIDFKDLLKKNKEDLRDEKLINYIENKLSTVQKNAIDALASQDADFAKKLALYKRTILTKENLLQFGDKSLLIKTEDDFLLNNKSLAYFENQLTAEERIEFETTILTHPIQKAEYDLVSKTKLLPDSSIMYPDKSALKKQTKLIVLFNYKMIVSIAASMLLLVGIFMLFNVFVLKPKNNNFATKHIVPLKENSDSSKRVIKDRDKAAIGLQYKALIDKKENKSAVQNKTSKNTPLKNQTPEDKRESVAQKNVPENNSPKEMQQNKPLPEEFVSVSTHSIMADSNEIAVAFESQVKSIKKTFLLTEEDVDADELLEDVSKNNKFNLWKRAVGLAKKAHQLGLKAIDGKEKLNNDYLLSFNSFSIEKK